MKYPSTALIPSFFHRISLRKKFLIMFLIALLGMSISLYYIFMTKKFSNQLLHHEINNIKYNREMADLLQALYKHQILIHRIFHGESSLKDSLKNVQEHISKHFENLKNTSEPPQNVLQYLQNNALPASSDWISSLGIEGDWKYLQKNALEISLVKSDAHHDQLAQEIRSFLLYLNPSQHSATVENPTSHYFINHVMQQLPLGQEQLVKILIYGENAIHAKKLTGEDRLGLLNALESLRTNVLNSQAYRQNLKMQESSMTEFSEALRKYFASVEEFILFTQNSIINSPSITIRADQFASLGDKSLSKSFELWNISTGEIEASLQQHFQRFIKHQDLTLFAIVLLTTLLILLGWLTMLEILNSIQELQTKTNLWMHAPTGPQFISMPMAAEFNPLKENFNKIACANALLTTKLKKAGIEIDSTSHKISETSANQKNFLVQQHLASKQISDTISHLSHSSKEFANAMLEITARSEQTEVFTTSSRDILKQMEEMIHQLIEVSGHISAKLLALTEKTSHIISVITSISKVADQTNLLSLNAAIEAEKAGEHGRSFSVIAREIRRLADQTTNATTDIEKMINEIVSAVSTGISGIDKFSQEIHIGASQAVNLKELLMKILENIQHQMAIFDKVTVELNHQFAYTDQMQHAIHELEDFTQRTNESLSQFMNYMQSLEVSSHAIQQALP
ncbi:MAG: chemotaxis protein [Parachlamydia sp.]|nr:MAG: chemotaxis protein [Parachlamydia sp.]